MGQSCWGSAPMHWRAKKWARPPARNQRTPSAAALYAHLHFGAVRCVGSVQTHRRMGMPGKSNKNDQGSQAALVMDIICRKCQKRSQCKAHTPMHTYIPTRNTITHIHTYTSANEHPTSHSPIRAIPLRCCCPVTTRLGWSSSWPARHGGSCKRGNR